MINRIKLIKEKFLKLDTINFAIYLVAPILALPTILYSLCKRTKYSMFLYSLFIAFCSFIFQPLLGWDKINYLEFYENIRYESYEVLYKEFNKQPDFILSTTIFICSKLGISIHFVIFLITFITIFTVFTVFRSYSEKYLYETKYPIITNSLFILSFSYIAVFSGVRFAFATSICFLGFYQGLFLKNRYGIIYVILAIFIHFSTFFFLLIYLIFPLLNQVKIQKLKLILALSLFFVFFPKIFLLDFLKIFGIPGLSLKAELYLGVHGFKDELNTFSSMFIRLFDVLWVAMIAIFCLLKRDKIDTLYYRIVVYLIIFINIFIALPHVFNKYILFLKLFVVLFLLDDQLKNNKFKIVLIFLLNFIVITINQLIIMRYSLKPLFDLDNLFLPFF